ncbi:MAG TPA: glyceraldehyde 3-phosphate dehydrogenase NAD-binding domain-containing protein [Bacteroidales bacterium]|nr:glyceraldehyde 3-phosphate dehydrogenase NAD-binding domain-containing protein [Bacteroidales bacterium]HSA44785.1 glyceraldehyde 3-phosphate dehydrogenase NAD-binding domain-containing protein [Bacteroidales bacterium]
MGKIKLGLMGFGEIGRNLYNYCLGDERFEVAVISDIGRPEILHYLLKAHARTATDVRLENNYLVSSTGKARIVHGIAPGHVPWDAFGVDVVIDATGKYLSRADMEAHLASGARRVFLSFLPSEEIDNLIVMGVNDKQMKASDRMISPGSATTNAVALLLKAFDDAFGVDYATWTAIHEYTADQPLRDVAGRDFRRSRSAAQNIIPNVSPSVKWIPYIIPGLRDRVEGTALNVPVPSGTLLDLNTFIRKDDVSLDDMHAALMAMAERIPHIVRIEHDPIVSSDVIGDQHSVVYDIQAAMKSSGKIFKTMSWFHSAASIPARIKELILAYEELDKKGGAQ